MAGLLAKALTSNSKAKRGGVTASVYALGEPGFWRISAADGTKEPIGDGVLLGQIRLLK